MFKSYDHFKKTTKIVFDTFKSNRNLKLSEFRNLFVEQTQHNNIQTYAASFDNKSHSKCESIQSAQVKTVSVIIIENNKILTKVDFIDNEIGLASARAFFIAHAKQYAFENSPNPEFTLKIAEYNSYGIDEGFLELSRNRTMQIIYSTEYGLKDTDEHKYSEMNEWRILALDANNLPPLPSQKRINIKELASQDISDAEILFPSKISRDFIEKSLDFSVNDNKIIFGSPKNFNSVGESINKNNSRFQELHIEKSLHKNEVVKTEQKKSEPHPLSTFKGKKLNTLADREKKKILFYLPSEADLINSIDNFELLFAISSFINEFVTKFNDLSEEELSKMVWSKFGFKNQ